MQGGNPIVWPPYTRNYDKLTSHLNPVEILNLQKHLQSANISYNILLTKLVYNIFAD